MQHSDHQMMSRPDALDRSLEHEQHPDVVVDAHVDLPYFMARYAPKSMLSEIQEGPFTLNKAKSAGIRLFFTAIYCEDRFNGHGSFAHFQEIWNAMLNGCDQVVTLPDTPDPLGALESDDAIYTLFLIENADPLVGQNAYIEQLRELGIRLVGLTHAGKNRLADGNAIRYSDGLTPEGKALIQNLVEHRILVDVAHLHPTCFRQLMKSVESPIVCSHTGIRSICDTPRNLDLEQVKEIGERGGVVGVTFNPEMLVSGRGASLMDVFAHIDTVVQRFGPKWVGIGSDFCGFDMKTEGLEDIAQIPSLIHEMEVHGYPRQAVLDIMGHNWLRVLQSVDRP
ncbi:MAG: membrane dipeptidase [Deltaproteobacteria bacterium]|nr:membrane dipeptidase [Deltaproteobacteria bacterium]